MGAEVHRYYSILNPTLRQKMNLGHDRPEVMGLEIATRGYVIQSLLAQKKIVAVPTPVATPKPAPLLPSVDNDKLLSLEAKPTKKGRR